MNRIAVITGITGQDGSYLAEYLLELGYDVIGIARRSSTENYYDRINHLLDNSRFKIIEGDITDYVSVSNIIKKYQPTEFYNLAAQSHVQTSFEQPSLTFNVNATGVLNILEAIRLNSPTTRFYQASTSEMFGNNVSYNYDVQGCPVRYDGPLLFDNPTYKERYGFQYVTPESTYDGVFQDEDTPFAPQSPYAVSKVAAHQTTQLYRKAYGIHASCGILFNHESERRGSLFVTRKITKWASILKRWIENNEGFVCGQIRFDTIPTRLYMGPYDLEGIEKLKLGNLEAMRDWGYAKDYVKAMHLIVNNNKPDDYVVATGLTYTVKDFLHKTLNYVLPTNIQIPHLDFVLLDNNYIRPAEVNYLRGNAFKIRDTLGWKPSVDLDGLIKIMVDHDVKKAKNS